MTLLFLLSRNAAVLRRAQRGGARHLKLPGFDTACPPPERFTAPSLTARRFRDVLRTRGALLSVITVRSLVVHVPVPLSNWRLPPENASPSRRCAVLFWFALDPQEIGTLVLGCRSRALDAHSGSDSFFFFFSLLQGPWCLRMSWVTPLDLRSYVIRYVTRGRIEDVAV